jgi:cytoskeletal protein RodZ
VANDKIEPSEISAVGGKVADAQEASLGSFLTEARKRRGISVDDLMRQTRIPAYYVRMIENDDYGLIADQLYVLPFLRKYAAFVGVDAEAVTTRFIHDVQRADSNAGRMPEPIPVAEKTRRGRAWIAVAVAAVIGLAIIAYLVLSRRHRSHAPAASSSTAAISFDSAKSSWQGVEKGCALESRNESMIWKTEPLSGR